ncbi:MAG: sporulation membrane protein YtaF [Clostridium perfringens]|uniref:Putative sporulation protein YtaF n=1 Tax=Clostridium perfringens TaxID=1502 RepID=A0A133N4W7_CLOPF|nr:sporulation membrane protein YtaF [Clostridium perfringens]EGT0012377.1 sporulation membrane protein YtaF [Clostridium perfringens]EGT0680199.1 sporulation membrane protein YtaF [Clostridium perfringens]EGT3605998.1 sporulation membrane protein YtaF [Clostridium perfringens]EGT4143085.1 sporulation membrane protein YtaF [Clostridium perfringens]EJT6170356.1 sporulation membrane protein YtaF [Clostridium perfringens]
MEAEKVSFLSILLFVIAASLDILVVSLAYGLKDIKINFSSTLVIASISALGTFISMILGQFLVDLIPVKLGDIIGGLVLLALGFYSIYSYFKEKKILTSHNSENNSSPTFILENPEVADKDKSGNIDFKESLALSLALALNNFGLGIGASISGLNIAFTTISTFIISLIFISLGFYLSKTIKSKNISKNSNLIAGIIIIILSLFIIF